MEKVKFFDFHNFKANFQVLCALLCQNFCKNRIQHTRIRVKALSSEIKQVKFEVCFLVIKSDDVIFAIFFQFRFVCIISIKNYQLAFFLLSPCMKKYLQKRSLVNFFSSIYNISSSVSLILVIFFLQTNHNYFPFSDKKENFFKISKFLSKPGQYKFDGKNANLAMQQTFDVIEKRVSY